VVARGDVPAGMRVHAVDAGAWLAPGFIDCQVNGGGDVLFNDDPSLQGIGKIVAAHRRSARLLCWRRSSLIRRTKCAPRAT